MFYGFHQVLLGFSGFYWVLLGFSRLKRCGFSVVVVVRSAIGALMVGSCFGCRGPFLASSIFSSIFSSISTEPSHWRPPFGSGRFSIVVTEFCPSFFFFGSLGFVIENYRVLCLARAPFLSIKEENSCSFSALRSQRYCHLFVGFFATVSMEMLP